MIFGVFRNERGMPEFAINLERDAKGMTDTPDERSDWSIMPEFYFPF